MFFSLSDFRDLFYHMYFFVCYWISLFFQSKLFFLTAVIYTACLHVLRASTYSSLYSVFMKIILMFQKKPQFPWPIFHTNRLCSQVIGGGDMKHLTAGHPRVLMKGVQGTLQRDLSESQVPRWQKDFLLSAGQGAAQSMLQNGLSNTLLLLLSRFSRVQLCATP